MLSALVQAQHQRSLGAADIQSAADMDMQPAPQQPSSKPYLDFLLTIVKGFGGCLELQYIRRWAGYRKHF